MRTDAAAQHSLKISLITGLKLIYVKKIDHLASILASSNITCWELSMRTFIPFVTAALLASTVLASTVHAGQSCHYLNAYDLSEEDVSIMESIRPVRAETVKHPVLPQPIKNASNTSSAARVCLLTVPTTDPQLSIEAGWDPVVKKVNCETGEILG
jgi:hypothetical protein